MRAKLARFLIVAALSCGFLMTSTASASVIGDLALSAGANTVTVGSTFINWSGSFTVSGATTLTYDGGTPLTIGSTGSLLNLSTATVFPLTNFMTFAAAPSLGFNLSTIGPGSANTNCATVISIGQSCSVFAGSPFLLTLEATGTEVSLAVTGVAHDGTLPTSNYLGSFSETITSLSTVPAGQVVTPLAIQNFFLANPTTATITSPYSGTFTATLGPTVPEPSTAALMLLASGGLILISKIRKPRMRRRSSY